MRQTIQKLEKFYNSPLGQASYECIFKGLIDFWPSLAHLRMLGFGYVMPYLNRFKTLYGENIAFQLALPELLGLSYWTRLGKNASVLIDEQNWPFPDSFYDRILIVHGLEEAESITALLQECCRVLAPKGRLMLVVPNRNSIWSRSEKTPFSSGQPFTKHQLEKRLKLLGLSIEKAQTVLFIPPLDFAVRAIDHWDYFGTRLWPGLGGVLLVEAVRQIPAFINQPNYKRVFLPSTP